MNLEQLFNDANKRMNDSFIKAILESPIDDYQELNGWKMVTTSIKEKPFSLKHYHNGKPNFHLYFEDFSDCYNRWMEKTFN
jgi:hypothetical protein